MKLVIGSDHGGFRAKEALIKALRADGHRVVDLGTSSEESSDYPDFAGKVGVVVARGKTPRGILVCGTGIGMSIAANKVKGVRAAVVWSIKTAALAAEHNGANVLCLGGRVFPKSKLINFARIWLKTPFGGGRHRRRLKKISVMEKGAGQ